MECFLLIFHDVHGSDVVLIFLEIYLVEIHCTNCFTSSITTCAPVIVCEALPEIVCN